MKIYLDNFTCCPDCNQRYKRGLQTQGLKLQDDGSLDISMIEVCPKCNFRCSQCGDIASKEEAFFFDEKYICWDCGGQCSDCGEVILNDNLCHCSECDEYYCSDCMSGDMCLGCSEG